MLAGTATSLLSQIGTPQTSPTSFTRQLDGGTTYAVYEATDGGSGTLDVRPLVLSAHRNDGLTPLLVLEIAKDADCEHKPERRDGEEDEPRHRIEWITHVVEPRAKCLATKAGL